MEHVWSYVTCRARTQTGILHSQKHLTRASLLQCPAVHNGYNESVLVQILGAVITIITQIYMEHVWMYLTCGARTHTGILHIQKHLTRASLLQCHAVPKRYNESVTVQILGGGHHYSHANIYGTCVELFDL